MSSEGHLLNPHHNIVEELRLTNGNVNVLDCSWLQLTFNCFQSKIALKTTKGENK